MAEKTQRQTLEQKRAKHGWADVEEAEKQLGNDKEKYGTLARKLPAMIQMNGLASTLAFFKAKGKSEHKMIVKHLSIWVLGQVKVGSHKDLIDLVRNESVETYRRATAESIEYGIWLKRYVEAKDWGSVDGDDT